MNHKFKMRQRVTALCMAAMICCGMLPYGALAEDSTKPIVAATPEQAATQEAKSESDSNSTATPETADESLDEDAPQQEPKTEGDTGGSDELYEIWHKMYPSLTQEPTGYYLDSYGLPVLVGETKISIEGWGNEDYSSVSDDSFQQVALDAALLDADSTTAAFPHMDGEDYAIVPISMQVMYPANGSSADITLPDNVELLGYSFTSGDLTPATEEERQSQLHYEFSEISASVAGIYVKASEDFSVTMTYTDATQTLTKTVHVTLDDSAPVPGILQDRFAQETQVAMCSADEGIATYAGLQVTQCVNTTEILNALFEVASTVTVGISGYVGSGEVNTTVDIENGNHYDLIYTLAGSSWYESVTGQQRHYTLQPLEMPPENYEPKPAQVGVYLSAPVGFSQHVIVYLQNLYTDDVYDLELYESNGLAAVEPNALSGKYTFLSAYVVGDAENRYQFNCEQNELSTETGADFHLTVTDTASPDREMNTPSRDQNSTVQAANSFNNRNTDAPQQSTTQPEIVSQPVKQQKKQLDLLSLLLDFMPVVLVGAVLFAVRRKHRR